MRYPIGSIGGVTLSEIPGKTSLVIEFNNCQQRCPGCHSPHLWEKDKEYSLNALLYGIGTLLVSDINCILLMGGTNNGIPLESLRKLVESIYTKWSIPVAIYDGRPETEEQKKEMLSWYGLFWLKTGDYREDLGGIEYPGSNQRLYEKDFRHTTINWGNIKVYPYWEDITHRIRGGV